MGAASSYFVACFACTLLWMMAGLSIVALVVAIIAGDRDAFDPPWSRGRRLRLAAWSLVVALVVIPSLTTLYAFWGWW